MSEQFSAREFMLQHRSSVYPTTKPYSISDYLQPNSEKSNTAELTFIDSVFILLTFSLGVGYLFFPLDTH